MPALDVEIYSLGHQSMRVDPHSFYSLSNWLVFLLHHFGTSLTRLYSYSSTTIDSIFQMVSTKYPLAISFTIPSTMKPGVITFIVSHVMKKKNQERFLPDSRSLRSCISSRISENRGLSLSVSCWTGGLFPCRPHSLALCSTGFWRQDWTSASWGSFLYFRRLQNRPG